MMTPFCFLIVNNQPKATDKFRSEVGFANGYLAVPPDHYAHGFDAMDWDGPASTSPFHGISVHGGVTWSKVASSLTLEKAVLPGGDETKLIPIKDLHVEIPEDWWILGFDTRHLDDSILTCPVEYCWGQTLKMAQEVERIAQEIDLQLVQEAAVKDLIAQEKQALLELIDQALPHERKRFEVFLGISAN